MEWLKEAPSQALQYSLRNLDTAYKNFFAKHADFPSFKKKFSKQSLSFPQGVSVEERTITFPKIGAIRAVIHRRFEGKIKTVTVTKRTSVPDPDG
jgi:putative transposase